MNVPLIGFTCIGLKIESECALFTCGVINQNLKHVFFYQCLVLCYPAWEGHVMRKPDLP